MTQLFDWFVEFFYYEGDMLKTFIGLFGFFVVFVLILEMFCVLKQGAKSLL